MFRLLVAFSGEGLPLERCATVWTVWSAWCNVDGVSTVVALAFYQFQLRSCLLWSCLASCRISTESAIEGVQIVGGSSAYLRDVVHSHILGMIYSLLLASVFLLQLIDALLLLALLGAADAGGCIFYHAGHLHHGFHLSIAVLLLHL